MYEHILLLGYRLNTEQLGLPGAEFMKLSQQILCRLVPFLSDFDIFSRQSRRDERAVRQGSGKVPD